MDRLNRRVVELAVGDARPSGDALNIARFHHRRVPHAVLMFERATNDVTYDLKIAVRVGAETLAALHAILVDHAQTAVTHVLRVVIIRKGKGVVAVQPAVIGVAAFVGSSNLNHGSQGMKGWCAVDWIAPNGPARCGIPRASRPG